MLRKLILLFSYIRTIRKNINNIKKHFIEKSKDSSYLIKDMNYDYVFRFYTVVNFKPDIEKNINTYGYVYLYDEVKKFVRELTNKFKEYGLTELVKVTKADQIGSNNVLIVVEYKFINTVKLARYLIIILLILLIGTIIIL